MIRPTIIELAYCRSTVLRDAATALAAEGVVPSLMAGKLYAVEWLRRAAAAHDAKHGFDQS